MEVASSQLHLFSSLSALLTCIDLELSSFSAYVIRVASLLGTLVQPDPSCLTGFYGAVHMKFCLFGQLPTTTTTMTLRVPSRKEKKNRKKKEKVKCNFGSYCYLEICKREHAYK